MLYTLQGIVLNNTEQYTVLCITQYNACLHSDTISKLKTLFQASFELLTYERTRTHLLLRKVLTKRFLMLSITVISALLVGWGLTALLTQNRSYIARVVPEISSRTDRQTLRQTYHNTSQQDKRQESKAWPLHCWTSQLQSSDKITEVKKIKKRATTDTSPRRAAE